MRHVFRWATIGVIAAVLAACANQRPTDGYLGPTAMLSDWGFAESGGKGQVFAVTTIDGKKIDDSFAATIGASRGMGFGQHMQIVDRAVPARPMKLVLKGSHTTGAPIAAIFSQAAGTFFSVEGPVDFTPEAGKRYVVKGELAKDGSSVWIEDADTDRRVTDKVTSR